MHGRGTVSVALALSVVMGGTTFAPALAARARHRLVARDALGALQGDSLPVRACSTSYGLTSSPDGFPGYLPARRQIPLAPTAVGSLAWFEGNTRRERGLALLGPRGWTCAALIAVDGSWGMTVSPRGTDPANWLKTQQQQIHMLVDYNGPGAATACGYFPSAVSRSPAPQDCTTPAGTTVTVENPHLAVFQSGSGAAATVPATQGFVLWYPQATNGTAYVSCQLPGTTRALCQIILNEALKRLRTLLVHVAAETVRATAPHH